MMRKKASVLSALLVAACATPMKAYAQKTGAQLWINHDREQNAKVPKAPAFVE